jgi:hypothetical protein
MDLIELSHFFIYWVGTVVGHIDTLGVLWLHPFTNNQDIHPAEQSEEEEEGRDKLEVEVEHVTEVKTVKSFHDDTE